jgi:hypothetical protein
VTVNVVKVTARIRSALQAVLVQKTAVAHQLVTAVAHQLVTAVAHQLVKSLSADRVQSDQLALLVQLAHLVLAPVDLLKPRLQLSIETLFLRLSHLSNFQLLSSCFAVECQL